jgi:hypothetical protein
MTSKVNAGHCGIENEAFDGNNNEDVVGRIENHRLHDTGAVADIGCDVISASPTASGVRGDHTVVDVWPDQVRHSADVPNGCSTVARSPGGVVYDVAAVVDGVAAAGKDAASDGDDLDICEIDYESDQMCDKDDVDDEETATVSNNFVSTENDGDVTATSTTTFTRRRCWPLARCSAKVRYSCSKFCRAVRVEVDDAREQIISRVPRPSCDQCCTVEKLGRRLPITRWLPKYR